MTKLGSFGKARPVVDASFEWFGTDVRVHPDLSDLNIISLFSGMQGTEDGADALKALGDLAAALVHPDDLDEFWKLARGNRQTMEDIAVLAMELIGALADRPTSLPSDSSDGQQTTDTRSTDVSSSQALRLLDGRPDLQVAVLRRQAG